MKKMFQGAAAFPPGAAGRVTPGAGPVVNRKRARGGLTLAACIVVVSLLLGLVPSLHAQQYTIDWYKIAGGGGTSTGGVYQVSGTIGQADAGGSAMSGGNYSLTGGFWSLYAVQTSGGPLLSITRSGNQAIVSWDSSVTGWTLQTNNTLAPGTWGNYAGSVVNNSVTITPLTGNLFFRLRPH